MGEIQPGTEVEATQDYEGRGEGDLAIRVGDVLTILKPTHHPDWMLARRRGDAAEGTISRSHVRAKLPTQSPKQPESASKSKSAPRNYSVDVPSLNPNRSSPTAKGNRPEIEQLQLAKWYHGAISRDESEKLVREFWMDGSFLIRDSSTHSGDYTLVVYKQGSTAVDHYHIMAVPETKVLAKCKEAAMSHVS